MGRVPRRREICPRIPRPRDGANDGQRYQGLPRPSRPYHDTGREGMMRVLVACEFSGVVRRAFRALGHDAWSCDLLPAEDGDSAHFRDDIFHVLARNAWQWDLMIAHPPCTYLSVSGLHWNKRNPERSEKTEDALDFVRALMATPIDRICIENPVSCISTRIRKPDQIIQPYQFGHDASKQTCLWLKGLPRLEVLPQSAWVSPRVVNGKKRWANQTDSGQNRLSPSENRWKERSKTYEGIAAAFAYQWGGIALAEAV